MKILKLMNIMISAVLITQILIASPLYVSAEVQWSDDFDDGNLEDWTVFGYDWTGMTIVEWDGDMIVEDGSAKSTASTSKKETNACHLSDIAFGTWSFDWKPAETPGLDYFVFISDDFDWVGKQELFSYGYAIRLDMRISPVISLFKYGGSEMTFGTLEFYNLDENLEGWHHIDVTRDEEGLFKVYFDKELVIEYTHIETIVSTKLCIAVFTDSSFDNVQVSNSVDPPEKKNKIPFISILLFSSFLIFPVIIRKMKQNKES
ncbi:MAG: hypothetical protein ACXAD7_04765 [Candidatus Kariarchaeaceae archaeon]|jgi:hypothetical protein